MRLNCDALPNHLKKGILMLEKYGFCIVDEVGVPINAIQDEYIEIAKGEQGITITYDTQCHFYMALARCIGMQEGTHRIDAKVKKFGVMIDCSRNAVPTPDMLKRFVCYLALAGYNYLELYTEDTYELKDEPYFGYKRGRYSVKEIQEIVAFADIFGFEIVPSIQTLAHLRSLRNWQKYFDHIDTEDILLVGDERTYALIRKMLQFCKEAYGTKRINIGTDEAFRLGKGKYAELHGNRPTNEIYLEHLNKVFQMCKEEGLEPEFWADAFFDGDCSLEQGKALFDGSQTPIYWYYNILEKEKHIQIIDDLRDMAGKVIYAGAFWKWSGYAPSNEYSERAIGPAFEAAVEAQVDHILMTTWGDGGDECSVFTVTPPLWYATEQVYTCDANINQIVKELTGYAIEEWKFCDQADFVVPQDEELICTGSKDLLSNDYLIGVLDFHIPDNADVRYEWLAKEYAKLAKRDSQFSYIFEMYETLCRAVASKATYSKRLYRAYHANDHETIRKMIEELPAIKKKLEEFYAAYRRFWLKESKGFGFEISDIRIGSLITRIETVKVMLEDYLCGNIEKIYELEEERISYWTDRPEENYAICHGDWPYSFTMNYVLHYAHTL